MNPLRRLRAWWRHPEVTPWLAVFFWWMTAAHVLWCVDGVRERFDARAKTQAARMTCESEGGFYGWPIGAEKLAERCFKETAGTDRETR